MDKVIFMPVSQNNGVHTLFIRIQVWKYSTWIPKYLHLVPALGTLYIHLGICRIGQIEQQLSLNILTYLLTYLLSYSLT
jgi:hypothetical protein